MDSLSWERIASVFSDALECNAATRSTFLDNACAGDPELRGEVEAMLAAHHHDGLAVEHRLRTAAELPAAASLESGSRLGAYRIDQLVGEGGMGEVYRGERVDGEYRQTVAIKLLRPGYLTAETMRRFRTERQVLASLSHPAIAAILDAGTAPDGRPYLVMQFVDGVPITEFCQRSRLSVADRLRLFGRVADVVQFAHGRLVVHRDLKPGNILVQPDGAPRLLDFGIAKLLDHGNDGAPLLTTRPESRVFTPEHAAPEQLRGEPAGTGTDVYGLGVLLFELLAGRRPFPSAGLTTSQAERVILEEEAPLPSAVAIRREDARKLRGDLDRIVLMALRKEPERRYASAGQLAEDVERHLRGLPVRAERDTVGYRSRKFIARNRAVVGLGTVVAAMLLGFSVFTAIQSRTVPVARDRAEQERGAAEDVLNVLTSLFHRSNPRIVPGGDTLRIGAFLDEAERQIDGLSDHPERQARMWRALGNVQAARDQLERARALLSRSWERQKELHGPDHPETARTYHELAMVIRLFEGNAAARPMLDTSLARLRRVLGNAASDVVIAVQDLALATQSADTQRALLQETAALQEQRPVADSVAIASLWSAQGAQQFAQGRYAEAKTLFEGALSIMASRVPPEHPDRMAVTRNLSVAALQLGEWSQAEALVRATLQLSRRPGSPNLGLAHDLTRLGSLAAHQGRLGEAEAHYREALAMLRSVVVEDHPLVDNALRNLGLVIAASGRVEPGLVMLDSAVGRTRARTPTEADAGYLTGQRTSPLIRLGRLAEARAAALESQRILTAATGEGDIRRAESDHWLGLTDMVGGDLPAALLHFGRAHGVITGLLPAAHPKRAMVSCAWGAALARTGRLAEARPHLETACKIHDRWGLADSLVTEWGRAALRSLPET